MTELSPGTRVQYSDGRQGVVKFNGSTHFSSGEWIGLELDDDSGKNDGSVKGERYFDCRPGHGMFVRPDTLTRLLEQPGPPPVDMMAEKPINGIEARSRQSIMSAETARKRQSLMGSGVCRSTPGSRQSLRSPAKSPTKVAPSHYNSSGQSSPRTSTPTTTARTSNSSAKSHLSINGHPSMGPPLPPTAKAQARQSIGGALSKSSKIDASSHHSRPNIRQSMLLPDRLGLSTSQGQFETRAPESDKTSISQSIDEEGDDDDVQQRGRLTRDQNTQSGSDKNRPGSLASPVLRQAEGEEVSTSQRSTNGLGIIRSKQDTSLGMNKELEQMKVKYKIMERKRMEDRDKLKSIDSLKADRDKFESTMQKLQRKCQTQSQEITEWRRKLQESEAKVDEIERADAERGTEIEMATLDKEMAEERLEAATAELESLKERCEELELEADIIRDENKELTSGMTSEERSSAGWLQMEKENQRLRDALVALRDMTQENEAGLKSHVKELEEDITDFDNLKLEHQKTTADLVASRSAIQTLKENLEAADSQELLVSELNEAKDMLTGQVQGLSRDVHELKQEIGVYQELLEAQDATERLLQEDLDAVQGLAREQVQQIKDKAKTIDNLESTLLRFKDVVHGLQADLEELRANKQVSETENNELNTKSRAILDLNLRLQKSAAMSQAKKIESELSQITAENTALHLDIIQHFVPDMFTFERDPVLTLLRSKRIASKAKLLKAAVEDEIDHTAANVQEDPYVAYDVMEKLQWVSACCFRSYRFMKGCSAEEFSRLDAALHELEPVERSLDNMLEAAKRKDIDATEWSENLQRMIALLTDLAEKTVPPRLDTFADTAAGMSHMMQLYSEIAGLELDWIERSVRIKVAQSEGDEDLPRFNQHIRRLVNRCSTSRVMTGKVLRAVEENGQRSMALGATSIALFEEAESIGKELCYFARLIGQGLLKRFNADAAGNEFFTFKDVSITMLDSTRDFIKQYSTGSPETFDALSTAANMVSGFSSKLEVLVNLASDVSNYSEFERQPAPWIARAKMLKEQKAVDPQMEEKLRRFQTEAHEQNVSLNTKDKTIEEQGLKIELLEARGKALKDNAAAVQHLEKDLEEALSQRDRALSEMENIIKEKHALVQSHAEANAKLVAVHSANEAGGTAAVAALGAIDAVQSVKLTTEIAMLKEEIASLQAAVCFLKSENHRLLYPKLAAGLTGTSHAWLETTSLSKPRPNRNQGKEAAAVEAKGVLHRLLAVTCSLEPLTLHGPSKVETGSMTSSWRPMRQSSFYLVSRQREELERYAEWKEDLLRRSLHGQRQKPTTRGQLKVGKSQAPALSLGMLHLDRMVDGVEIAGSSP